MGRVNEEREKDVSLKAIVNGSGGPLVRVGEEKGRRLG